MVPPPELARMLMPGVAARLCSAFACAVRCCTGISSEAIVPPDLVSRENGSRIEVSLEVDRPQSALQGPDRLSDGVHLGRIGRPLGEESVEGLLSIEDLRAEPLGIRRHPGPDILERCGCSEVRPISFANSSACRGPG